MAEMLKPSKVAYSLATVTGIIYLLCAMLVAIAPTWTVNTFGALFHGIDVSKIARDTVPVTSTIIGLIEIFILSLSVGWLFAVIYNKFKWLFENEKNNKQYNNIRVKLVSPYIL